MIDRASALSRGLIRGGLLVTVLVLLSAVTGPSGAKGSLAYVLAAPALADPQAPGGAPVTAHITAVPAPVGTPSLADPGVHRIRSEVSIAVDGATRVARFEVLEEFRNDSGRIAEGEYLYPIPAGAVFQNLSLFMGETELRGEMLPADRARGIYEDIVRRLKDPALIELLGNGLIRARVFPIQPGETRKIILRYTQVLPRAGEAVRLGYPRSVSMIDTRFHGPEVEPVLREEISDVRHPMPTHVTGAASPFALRVVVENASRFGTPYSPTDSIAISARPGDVIEIGLADAAPTPRDFELLLPMSSDDIGATVIAHAPGHGEDGFFLLLVTPPPAAESERIPRDVTLVLDTSGSMSGHKIQAARSAMEQVLRGLTPTDRFRLVTFSSAVRVYDDQFCAATAEQIADAIAYLHSIPADGSTNVQGALETALAPSTPAGRLPLVVFLTDGQPTVGETDPVRIGALADRLRDDERVFAFGLGHDVNTYLLDSLVDGGRGAVEYIASGNEVEGAVATLGRKISAPVLADLRIVDTPAVLGDAYPSPLPDLFHGEELVMLGRYRDGGSGRLVIEGTRSGRTQRLSFDVELPARRQEDEFLTRLWAARKAGHLTAQLRLHGPNDEVIEEIRQLGLRYGVLTEYTSYLVVEPGMGDDRNEAVRRVADALDAPAEQTGRAAYKRSDESSRLRQAGSLREAEEVLVAAAPPQASAPVVGERDADRAAEGAWRAAGGRLFVLRGGLWTDVEASAGQPELRIAPFSSAWLELVERWPGLQPSLALGDGVIIEGEGLTLRIEAGGVEELGDEDRRRLAGAFAADAS